MKTVGVLVLVLMLVAGIAVNGSRAQPLNATSVAFEQCLGMDPARADRCQPLVRSLVAQTEFEAAGADRARDDAAAVGAGAAGEGNAEIGESRSAIWIALAALVWEVARYFLDRHRDGGGFYRGPTIVAETVFDPIR